MLTRVNRYDRLLCVLGICTSDLRVAEDRLSTAGAEALQYCMIVQYYLVTAVHSALIARRSIYLPDQRHSYRCLDARPPFVLSS